MTAAVFIFLLFFGLPLLQSGQLTELLFSSWSPGSGLYGIYPMMTASVLLTTLSMLMSLPISLGLSFLITSLVILAGYLILGGGSSLQLSLIFGDTSPIDAILLKRQVFDGLFPAIVGTFLLIFGSMLIAVPVGIAGGIYMAEYCNGKIKPLLNLAFDILAGMPSIVIGLAGLLVTILLHRYFHDNIIPCLLISCCSLALLILPYLIRTTQTALESTPPLIRKTAPALDASHLQNIFHVLLPNSISDIISGIILVSGRCAEDTAVIMLTGVVATAGVSQR